MLKTINFVTDNSGQVITEPCYDAELVCITWNADEKTIKATFKCPKNTMLKITFIDVIRFKVDGLEMYNVSTTFFTTLGCEFDEKLALQYLEELFCKAQIADKSRLDETQKSINEALTSCLNGICVIFANDAAAGCVITILSKSLIAEFL